MIQERGTKRKPQEGKVPRPRDKPVQTGTEEHKGMGGRSHEKKATGGPVVFGNPCLLSVLQVLRTLFSN